MTFIRQSLVAAVLGLYVPIGVIGFAGGGVAFAQSPSSSGRPADKSSAPTGGAQTGRDDGAMAPVIQWLERANREYQDTVVQQLSVPTGKGGDASSPAAKALQAKPAQPAADEPSVLQQVQDWLGLGGDKPTTQAETTPTPSPSANPSPVGSKETAVKGTPEQDELEKRAAEEAVRRQKEARAQEAQRAADEQRLLTEAKKAKDAVDQATRERQALAENARLAEEQRRAAGSAGAPKNTSASAEKDAKAAAEAKQAETLARDRVKALAEKALADKARVEKDVEAAKKAQQAAEAKTPVAPQTPSAPPKDSARAPEVKPDPTAKRDDTLKNDDPPKSISAQRDAPVVAEQGGAKAKSQAGNDVRDAERLASAANRAGSSAMEKIARPSKGQKTKVVGAEMPFREAKQRGRDGRKCQGAGDEVDPPATYVVKRGDTLWSISKRHYEKGHRFVKIVRANDSKIDDPDLIFPCQKLMLPG